jgi:hypothetical protein
MFTRSSLLRTYTVIAALIGWSAILLQGYLSLRLAVDNGRSIGAGIAIYLGFFTVLTNILAAPLLTPHSTIGKFFSRPGVNTATAACIAIVGMVYSLLLRHIWNPQGLQLVVDITLHDVMPVLFLVYWWIVVPKSELRWIDIFSWMLYPVGYLLYSLARGGLTGLYPYPFIDVNTLGYGKTLTNAAAMLAAYVFITLMLIGAGRLQKHHST